MVQRWQVCLSATAFLGLAAKAHAEDLGDSVEKLGQGFELWSLKPAPAEVQNARAQVGGAISLAGDVVSTIEGVSKGGDARAIATTKAGLQLIAMAVPGGVVLKVGTDILIEKGVDRLYGTYVVQTRAERAYNACLDRLDRETGDRILAGAAKRDASNLAQIPANVRWLKSVPRVVGTGNASFVETDLNEVRARQTLEKPECLTSVDANCVIDPNEDHGATGWRITDFRLQGGSQDITAECMTLPVNFESFVDAFLDLDLQRPDGGIVCSVRSKSVDQLAAKALSECRYTGGGTVVSQYNFEKNQQSVSISVKSLGSAAVESFDQDYTFERCD